GGSDDGRTGPLLDPAVPSWAQPSYGGQALLWRAGPPAAGRRGTPPHQQSDFGQMKCNAALTQPSYSALLRGRGWLALAERRPRSDGGKNGINPPRKRSVVFDAAATWPRVLVRGGAGALDHVSPCALHRRTRPGSKIEADAVHDAAADCRRYLTIGERSLPVRRSLPGGRVPNGLARRAHGWTHRRSDHHDSGFGISRMAGHAGGVSGGAARGVYPAGQNATKRFGECFAFSPSLYFSGTSARFLEFAV